MNTFTRALKFLAFYSLNQLPFFSNQRTEQTIKLRGQVFGILTTVRRHREPRSGLSTSRQEQREVIFEMAGPLPPGTKLFQAILHPRDRRTGLVTGVARGGGELLQVELNHT